MDFAQIELLLPAVLAFSVCITLLLVLRPVARALRLYDRPGGHKRHEGEVPVIGGLCIYLAVFLTALGGVELNQTGVILLVTGGMLVGMGAVDDRFDLPASVRLVGHLSAAMLLCYSTGFKVEDLGDLFGFGVIELGPVAVAFTVIACIALINAFNMLDGLDGLAGGVALVAFVGISALAATHGSPTALHLSLCLIGAIAAFLLFNLPAGFNRPVRTFMGDAGSTLLGFVLAGLALKLVQTDRGNIDPICLVWMLPIPIFELFASTARRLRKGLSPLAADRGHYHHRLMDAGFSIRGIFMGYLGFSAITVAIGTWACRNMVSEAVLLGGFTALFLAWETFVRLAPRFVPRLPPRWQRQSQSWV